MLVRSGAAGAVLARRAERHPNRTVSFPFAEFGARRIDPFFNVNTPEDYAMAETILKEQGL